MIYPKYFPLVVILFSGFGLQVHAQHVALRGIVIDSVSLLLLEEATVSLFRMQKTESLKTELIGQRKSDASFAFQNLGKGNYVIVTSYQGYARDSFASSGKAKDSSVSY